jgi:hypothetical protein
MAIAADLHAIVDEFAARLETLDLSGDDQEEYSTMLSWLENRADREESNGAIVVECVAYFGRYGVRSGPHAAWVTIELQTSKSLLPRQRHFA